MSSIPFERIKELLGELQHLDPEQRRRRVAAIGADDPELGAEVEAFLAHADQPLALRDRSLLPVVSGSFVNQASPWVQAAPTPERIGRYHIRRQIAAGGMGTVYEAEQQNPPRVVALKTVRLQFQSAKMLKRFRLEAELLGRLQHRGIAQIFEAGTFDAGGGLQPYFAMEFIRGLRLTDHAEQNRLDRKARTELFIEICEAVQHAHQRGIVHRDLKPDNILIQPDGQPKILDFGVARSVDSDVQLTTIQTEVGQLIGTVPYMSPEQVVGDAELLDTRSDVYALGVLLYELLSGRRPHDLRDCSIAEAARIIQHEEPTRLGSMDARLRGDLETIVGKALEKDVERRYPSAHALAEDLKRYLAHAPISARPPSTIYQLRKFARRNKGLVAGAVSTLLVAVVGATIASWFAIDSQRYARQSERNAAAAEWAASRSQLGAALVSLEGMPGAARAYLDEVPEVHRNWEWHHLAAQLEPIALLDLPVETDDDWQRRAIAFPAGGDPLVARTLGREARLVNLRTEVTVQEFPHADTLEELQLSADGRLLATVSQARTRLGIWDARSGEQLLVFPQAEIHVPCFNATGRGVAFQCSGGAVAAVDVSSGEQIFYRPADPDPDGRLRQHLGAQLSDSGEYVAVTTDHGRSAKSVSIYSVEMDEPLSTKKLQRLLAFSGDPPQLIRASGDDIVLQDPFTHERLRTFHGLTEWPQAASLSADGRRLAGCAGSQIVAWDFASGEVRRALAAHRVRSIALSSTGQQLVASTDLGIALHDLDEGATRTLRDDTSYVYALAFSPDGSLLASAGYGAPICLWDTHSGDRLATLRSRRSPVHAIGFGEDGSSLTVLARRRVETWNLEAEEADAAGEVDPSGSTDGTEDAPDPDPDADTRRFSRFALRTRAGSKGGEHENVVCAADSLLWSTRDSIRRCGQERVAQMGLKEAARSPDLELTFPEDASPPALDYHPASSRIVSAHWSGAPDRHATLRLWDAGTGALLRTWQAHRRIIHSVAFSPDGTRIVTGSDDQTLGIHDVERGEQVLELRGHESYVHAAVFSPDGTQIASGSGDGTIRLWDSVPRYLRARQAREEQALRDEMQPRVEQLFAAHGAAADVAAALRAASDLDPAHRAAALRVLMLRCLDAAARR